MKKLFAISGFLSYTIVIFLNTLTDLGHKVILQNTIFKSYDGSELIILTAIINALILLPFIFLFSPSGYLSDKYPKTKIIKYASLSAIGITILILVSYYMGLFWVSFGLTLALSVQSAIYSPAKYALIRDMTGNSNLAVANALVQAITIVSILAGAVIFSYAFEELLANNTYSTPSQILPIIAPLGYILILASMVEYLFARVLIKKVSTNNTNKKLTFSIKSYLNLGYLKSNIKILTSNKSIWLSIVGLAILWGVAQVLIAIFGEYLKSTLGIIDTTIAQGLLSISGLGIVVGSLMAGKISKNFVETGLIPLGAMGVAISLYFLASLDSLYLIGLSLFGFGFFAGIFIVPLNAIIQFSAPKDSLGRILAGNNFIQNLSMFLFLILTALFGYLDVSSKTLLYLISIVAFVGMGYTLLKLPQSLIRYLVRFVIGMKYHIKVSGLDNIPSNCGVLLLGNHVSFLDWAILQIAYPKQISFVMHKSYYNKWYLKKFLDFFGVIPISSGASKEALAQITQALNSGKTVALFPEGHLSRNGHIDTFQRGFEIALRDATEAVIVPFYLHGLWGNKLSHASNKLKTDKNITVSVSFGKILVSTTSASEVKQKVFDLSISSWEEYSASLPSIPKAWLKSAKKLGKKMAVADSTGVELSGDEFIVATLLIASKLQKPLQNTQNIGIIMPSVAGGYIVNMAVLTLGKTIVNLNYSSGEDSLSHASNISDISTIITSSKFIKKLDKKGFDLSVILNNYTIIYIEDLQKSITKFAKISHFLFTKLAPVWLLNIIFIKNTKPNDTASILFSSGSEGIPKGIELSHQNIMGNIKQTTTLINPTSNDVMLGTLPIFHSFGMTITMLLPLVEAMSVVCHPDPTDGFGIGKLSNKYQATILFATATFFRLYTRNKKLHPLMFANLRMVVAGAEKLPINIKKDFKTKFGLDIYEGYGASETTPVASVNIPDVLMSDTWKLQVGHKQGSVGLPLPGSSVRIVDPDSFETLDTGEDGMILIGGTQIMKGYLKDIDKTASVITHIDGIKWYITGDKGHIDSDGFIHIVDRYSRFAKVAGEMVSLGLVEGEISKLCPEIDICLVAIPDEKKGEKLILLVTSNVDLDILKLDIKALGLNPLYIPNVIIPVDEIPKLGSGKTDFGKAKKLALPFIEPKI